MHPAGCAMGGSDEYHPPGAAFVTYEAVRVFAAGWVVGGWAPLNCLPIGANCLWNLYF